MRDGNHHERLHSAALASSPDGASDSAADGSAAGGDPEARVQHARELAWRSLNRRDRTVSEVRELMANKGVEPEAAETVVAELLDSGYLDDARYAIRFAEDRRRLDAWGRERIERRLAALGVAPEHIAAAVSAQGAEQELASARELLARRHPGPLDDARERSRALGLLVRHGYDGEVAYEAIRRHDGCRGHDD